MLYDYGQYRELADDKRFSKFIALLNAVSTKVKVRYAISGGVASFLYSSNPPVDYPDVDVIVEGNAEEGERFLLELVRDRNIKVDFVEKTESDIFASLVYAKDILVDFLTMAEMQGFIFPPFGHKSGIALEGIESLVVGKIARGFIGDYLMAFDMLLHGRYKVSRLMSIARSMDVEGVLSLVLRLVSDRKRGRIGDEHLKIYARHLSKKYGAGK